MGNNGMVSSENKVNIPDGIYTGTASAYEVTINSQDYFGHKIKLKYGIKGTVRVIVLVKGFAFLYANSIPFQKS